MIIKPGMKIIATNTDYPEGVPNGTIMTVAFISINGAVHASVDGGDGFYWFMEAGTYEPYIVKSDDTAPAADTPVLWRDMTPAEKGALLLAHHEGKAIEAHDGEGWYRGGDYISWSNTVAYRVKPEAKVETVRLNGGNERQGIWAFRAGTALMGDTHRITFNLIDGKPDVASIKMEEL